MPPGCHPASGFWWTWVFLKVLGAASVHVPRYWSPNSPGPPVVILELASALFLPWWRQIIWYLQEAVRKKYTSEEETHLNHLSNICCLLPSIVGTSLEHWALRHLHRNRRVRLHSVHSLAMSPLVTQGMQIFVHILFFCIFLHILSFF